MFLSLLNLILLEQKYILLIVGLVILLVAFALVTYFRRRLKSVEKEPEEDWNTGLHTIFTKTPTTTPTAEPIIEQMETGQTERVRPVEPSETQELAAEPSAQAPDVITEAPPTVFEPEVEPIAPRAEPEQAPRYNQTELLYSGPHVEAFRDSIAEEATQESGIETSKVEDQLEARTADEAVSFDEEVWARLDTKEQGASPDHQAFEQTESAGPEVEREIQPPPIFERYEPRRDARVSTGAPREPFEPPRIERVTHRESFEPPTIEPLTPREQASLMRKRSPQTESPPDERETVHREERLPMRGPALSEPQAPQQESAARPDYTVASSYPTSPADYPSAAPPIDTVRSRRTRAGSVLGLPAESTDKPLVLGEPVRSDEETGIGSLSQYGNRPKEKTGHTGTIVLLIITLIVGAVIAAIYFNLFGVGDRFNAIFAARKVEDKSAKARIVGLSPTATNNIAKAGGYVENISNEKLEGLSVEVTLKRIDDSVINTLNLPIVPDTLGPGERGKFEFEYPVDAGVSTYSVLKLKSNDKQVFFTSNQQR